MGAYLSQPITNKNTIVGTTSRMSFCCSEMQGWRRNMEDSAICQMKLHDGNSLFGVFDGHGGHEVSHLVKQIFLKHLLSNQYYHQKRYVQALDAVFSQVDSYINSEEGEKRLLEFRYENGPKVRTEEKISQTTGCTANVILITPNKIYTANAGDSRSALFRCGRTVELSTDHKPQLIGQLQRIQNAGGSVVMGRVNGGLNLSRAFGDFRYKNNYSLTYEKQMITCKPDITQTERNPNDQFILMGCDGIWQRYVQDSHQLLLIMKDIISKESNLQKLVEQLLDQLIAIDTSSGIGCDNMTSILIKFK